MHNMVFQNNNNKTIENMAVERLYLVKTSEVTGAMKAKSSLVVSVTQLTVPANEVVAFEALLPGTDYWIGDDSADIIEAGGIQDGIKLPKKAIDG